MGTMVYPLLIMGNVGFLLCTQDLGGSLLLWVPTARPNKLPISFIKQYTLDTSI